MRPCEGSMQGRHSCRDELGTCSVQAVSCVQSAYSDLFACICGLLGSEFKGMQDLPGSFAPAWQSNSNGPIPLDRTNAVPTHCQPRMHAGGRLLAGPRGWGAAGGNSDTFWGVGWEIGEVCMCFLLLHLTHPSPDSQQTPANPSCPATLLPMLVAPLPLLR